MGQMCVPAVLIEIKTGSRLACGNKVANTTRRFRVLPPDKQVSQHFIETRLDRSRTFGTFARLLDGSPTTSIRLPTVPLVTRSDRVAETGPAIGASPRTRPKMTPPFVAFRSAKGRSFAERKTTLFFRRVLTRRTKHKLGRPLPFDATADQNCASHLSPELLGPESPSQ